MAKLMTTVDSEPRETPAPSTTARVLALLCSLAESENGSSVRALAQQTGMSRSATHRTLQIMAEEGFVTKDEQTSRYTVGHKLIQVAARVLSGSSLVGLADEVMARLVHATGETAYLAMFVPNEKFSTFVHRVECSKPLRYVVPVGMKMPLHTGAAGKAILAACDEKAVGQLDLLAHTSISPDALPRLQTELKEIRERGFATSIEEQLEGAAGVAAPIYTSKYVAGSLTLTVPVNRIPETGLEVLGPFVRRSAQELSQLLENSPQSMIGR